MQNEAVRDQEGLRRAAWIVVWILAGLLAFVSLMALGRVLRDVVGTILFSLGGFDTYAGIFRVGAMLFVVLAALLLPVAIVLRLVRARRVRSSGGQQSVFWPAFDIPLLILAALLVLTWSALALPVGRWPRSGVATPWDGFLYLGLILLAGGIALFVTDPHLRRASASEVEAGAHGAATKERAVRERSYLGAFTLGVLLMVVATTGLLGALGLVHIDPLMYPALALTILGAGLFIGTWVGRARWLTVLCVLTLPFVAVANVVSVPFAGGIGDVTYAPDSTAELQSAYQLGVGDLDLDLTALGGTAADATTSMSLTAGTIRIYVPGGTKVVVDTSVRAGDISVFRASKDGVGYGSSESGLDLTDSSTFGSDSPGLIHVMVDCGFCSVNISTELAENGAPRKNSGGEKQQPDNRSKKEKS